MGSSSSGALSQPECQIWVVTRSNNEKRLMTSKISKRWKRSIMYKHLTLKILHADLELSTYFEYKFHGVCPHSHVPFYAKKNMYIYTHN